MALLESVFDVWDVLQDVVGDNKVDAGRRGQTGTP
jgi:hypothetical protein